jgi:hypothetical protein
VAISPPPGLHSSPPLGWAIDPGDHTGRQGHASPLQGIPLRSLWPAGLHVGQDRGSHRGDHTAGGASPVDRHPAGWHMWSEWWGPGVYSRNLAISGVFQSGRQVYIIISFILYSIFTGRNIGLGWFLCRRFFTWPQRLLCGDHDMVAPLAAFVVTMIIGDTTQAGATLPWPLQRCIHGDQRFIVGERPTTGNWSSQVETLSRRTTTRQLPISTTRRIWSANCCSSTARWTKTFTSR